MAKHIYPVLSDNGSDVITAVVADNISGGNGTASEDGQETIPLAIVEKRYHASVYPGKKFPLPKKFVESIQALEAELDMPVWFLIQNGDSPLSSLSNETFHTLFLARNTLPENEPIALLIESPGGLGRVAYKIANLIKHRCGGFTAVIPQYAKSAATLLSLGADEIILGPYAELGPLDAQIFDVEREDRISALDEVKAVEHLHSAALEAVDQSVISWLRRSGKKLDTLLPSACTFVSNMMKPMFEKIDTVHFTQMSRVLKEAEEYAVRLLKPRYDPDVAKQIASRLVEKYPEHGFCIDAQEAISLGLEIKIASAEQEAILDKILPYLNDHTLIGRLQEVKPHGEQEVSE